MLNMYLYCSKLIINMPVSINGRIRIDVSDGKKIVGSMDRRTANPRVCNISGEPRQSTNRTLKTVKSRDWLNACKLSF
jgi:hypothetical protein